MKYERVDKAILLIRNTQDPTGRAVLKQCYHALLSQHADFETLSELSESNIDVYFMFKIISKAFPNRNSIEAVLQDSGDDALDEGSW